VFSGLHASRHAWRGRTALLVLAFAPFVAAKADPASDHDLALSRGQEIANAISTVTSTAISPLVGVCLFGAYQYARTPSRSRPSLPFYSKPPVWISLAVLLILIFLKDTIAGAVPLLKKPLDALEVLVINKASLILLAVPFMIHQVLPLLGINSANELLSLYEPVAYADDFRVWHDTGRLGLATFVILAGLAVTFAVWLVGHAIDVLVFLTPFPFIDVILKAIRTGILLAIVITSQIDRRAGSLMALLVIAIAVVLFSTALRLTVAGYVFSWDLIRLMVFRHQAKPENVQTIIGFTAVKMGGLPRWTFGRLTRDSSGHLEFRCRRFGFGPSRRIRLEDASAYEIGRGMLYPCIILADRTGSALQFRLPPRYNGVERQVGAALGTLSVKDMLLRKGLRAFWRWAGGTAQSATGDT